MKLSNQGLLTEEQTKQISKLYDIIQEFSKAILINIQIVAQLMNPDAKAIQNIEICPKFQNSMALCEATGLEVYMDDPNKAKLIFSRRLSTASDKSIQKGVKVLAKKVIQLEAQIMALNQRYPHISMSPVKAAFLHARNLPYFDQVN